MFRFVPARCVIENFKKITKKLKNTIKNSFQAKIGWKKMRNGKNKNYRSVPFRSYTTRNRKFQTNRKKIEKLNNTIMASFQAKNRLEKAEKEKK